MKPEQNLPTRKWVSFMMFASLVIVSLISAPLVSAQAEDPQTPTIPATPTHTLTIDPSVLPATETPAATSTGLPTTEPEEASPAAGTEPPAQVAPYAADGAEWSLEYDLAVPDNQVQALGGESARDQAERMLASKGLQARGISAQVSAGDGNAYRVALKGSGGPDVLRGLIFSDLQPELDLLNGPVELTISAPVARGQDISLLLESRPATGYQWELDPAASTGVAQADLPLVMSKVEQPSAPAVEGLLLRGSEDGQASMRLVYHRPWEAGQEPTRRLRLTLPTLSGTLDLSSPVPVEQQTPPELELSMLGEPSVGLPSAFDWRSQGKTPPVRDQGGCGSCWSFGTVGAMESALMVQGGLAAQNLSEQYLIDCNTDNYGCNGGWWAHDYHVSKLGANQTSAGAVLESVRPYQAAKNSCSANLAKAYKLGSWGYVNGGYNSIPSVDQLKNAIYNYGSAAVSVCAGSAWSSYRGGVFTTDEKSQCTGTGQVNHAVLLVGWNDADQTWLLRNSWGSSWGDGGYMHIRWGTSNVGYGASYVVYSGGSIPTATKAPTATKTVTPTPKPTATKTPAPTAKPTITRTPTRTSTPLPAPAGNDNVGSANTINYQGGIYQFTEKSLTTGATTEGTDPYFPTSPAKQFAHSIWYKFTPFTKGTLAVSTTGSNYDTVLGVFTGQPGAWTRVKWNDNYSTYRTSSLSFTAAANTTYYIEVAAKTSGGVLSFKLKFTPPVLSNNSVSSASTAPYAGNTVASSYSAVQDIGRSTIVTSDPVFPNNYGRGYRTTWYRFTPKVNGTLQVSTSGSNFNNLIGIWNKGTKYTLVGWTNGGSGQVAVTSGKTYYIEVAGIDKNGPSILKFSLNFIPGS